MTDETPNQYTAPPRIAQLMVDHGITVREATNRYALETLGLLPGELLPEWLVEVRDALLRREAFQVRWGTHNK
jgi:hypothetical protein